MHAADRAGRSYARSFASQRRTARPSRLPLLLAALAGLLLLRRATRPARGPPFCAVPPPLVCAHGGDISGGALANTLPAYAAALANPAVSCVEVDVSRSRDDHLVALHQRQLLQLGDGEYENVADARLEQLRFLARGEEGRRVLTLREALGALQGSGLRHIILDIKDAPPRYGQGFAAKLLELVTSEDCDACLPWSRDDAVTAELVAAGYGSRAGFVVMNATADARARGMHKVARVPGAAVAAVHWEMADARLVGAARSRGVRVFGWTANEVRMMDSLVRAGAYAIITDKASVVAERIAALRQACG